MPGKARPCVLACVGYTTHLCIIIRSAVFLCGTKKNNHVNRGSFDAKISCTTGSDRSKRAPLSKRGHHSCCRLYFCVIYRGNFFLLNEVFKLSTLGQMIRIYTFYVSLAHLYCQFRRAPFDPSKATSKSKATGNKLIRGI